MNKFLKFALIPLALLLLLFTTETIIEDDEDNGNSGLSYEKHSIGEYPECAEVCFTKTYSGSLDEFGIDDYTITVPSMAYTFIYVERSIRSCEELARPLIWWPFPFIPETDCVLSSIYNMAEDFWVVEDCVNVDTYCDGDSFWVGPGSYTLTISSLAEYTVCYDITIEIWGCSIAGEPYTPPVGPKVP